MSLDIVVVAICCIPLAYIVGRAHGEAIRKDKCAECGKRIEAFIAKPKESK